MKTLETYKWDVFIPYNIFAMIPQGREEKRSEKALVSVHIGVDFGRVGVVWEKNWEQKSFYPCCSMEISAVNSFFFFYNGTKVLTVGGNSNTADLKILVTPHYSSRMWERGDWTQFRKHKIKYGEQYFRQRRDRERGLCCFNCGIVVRPTLTLKQNPRRPNPSPTPRSCQLPQLS